jgi:TPR repeat protein
MRSLILSLSMLLACVATPVHAQPYEVDVGLRAFQSGDFTVAIENFTQGAMLGHAVAQFNLGLMYHQGIGTEADYEKAMQLYALAAQQGITQAQFNLGLMYDRGEGVAQDYREAYYWYLQAAEKGSADGQYAVGTMNFYGQGRREDYAEALRWYQESARQGHRDAQYNLGVMHLAGMGTEANPTVALTWFEMAADAGSRDAQYNSAMMYASGRGVARNPIKARDYFLMAAEQGLRDAQAQLGLLYVTGDAAELPRDYEQAQYWFNQAAYRGDSLSQFFLGRIHAEGLGTEADPVIGHMWYEISYRFGYERGEFYMDQLRAQMSAEQIEQAEVTALRWMIAYASRNPGSARLRREPVRPVPGSNQPAPGVQAL